MSLQQTIITKRGHPFCAKLILTVPTDKVKQLCKTQELFPWDAPIAQGNEILFLVYLFVSRILCWNSVFW